MQQLLIQAEQADQTAVPDGMDLPEEIARREERLATLAQARAKIEVHAKERYARELAEYQDKLARWEEKIRTNGKKPDGKPPTPPAAGPAGKDQINLTDEESHIMPASGGGFEQAYNAQAVVDTDSMHASHRTGNHTSLQRSRTGQTDARSADTITCRTGKDQIFTDRKQFLQRSQCGSL